MKKYIYLFVFALFAVSSCDKVIVIDEYNPELEVKKEDNKGEKEKEEAKPDTDNKNFTLVGIWKGEDKDKKYAHKLIITKHTKKSNYLEGVLKVSEYQKTENFTNFDIDITYAENNLGKITIDIKTINKTTKEGSTICKELTYILNLLDNKKVLSGVVDCPKTGTNITLTKQ